MRLLITGTLNKGIRDVGHRSVRAIARAVERRLPASRRLAFEYLRYARHADFRRLLDAQIAFGVAHAPSRELALDVGANCGLYTFRFARHFRSVVAFEPNREVSEPLRVWERPGVTVLDVAASDREGHATLYVPWAHGQRVNGYGSFQADNLATAERLDAITVMTQPLDAFGFDRVGLLKIDVEGHELAVLRGAEALIARWRPVILCEAKAAAHATLLVWCAVNRYRALVLRADRYHEVGDAGPDRADEEFGLVPMSR